MTARLRHLRHRILNGIARGRLDRLKSQLRLGNAAGRSRTFTFTANNTTDQITIAGQDTLAANNPRVTLSGNLPAGLEAGRIYWLADVGTNLYTLHRNKADAVAGTNDVTFTTDGTGTLTLTIL